MQSTMKLRAVTRAVVFDPEAQKLLLVRNNGASYWYPPGGGWDFDRESVPDGAVREVLEETGLTIEIIRLLYVQQFQNDAETMYLELFWLARPVGTARSFPDHKDLHGAVEEVRWFAKSELGAQVVFPERLKTTFWGTVNEHKNGPDPFIYAP